MQLSIILPVYNVEDYLSICLDSIISQSFKDYEIICVDDCSTDNSYLILKKYSEKFPHFKIIKNKQNMGVAASRNIGLKNANGEYIHFLDPDDWLAGDVYRYLIDKINANKNLDILFFNYRKYDNKSKEFQDISFVNTDILEKELNPVMNAEAFDNWERMCWLKFIRREFLVANNISFPNYISLSDVEWAAETYVKANSIYYTDLVVVNYRTNRQNSLVKIANKSIKQIFESCMNNRKRYLNLPDRLKYRMLAADYYTLTTGIPEAYKKKIINIIDLYRIIKEINKGENLEKYIFDFRCDYGESPNLKYPILKFEKIVIQTFSPKIFDIIVKIKKLFK